MTTLNRHDLKEELKAYREMGYILQIPLTASTEAMQQEYNRVHALDNAPVADGYDYGDMTSQEIEEAGVTITEADTGKYINQEIKPRYSGYDYCNLEDKELQQILDDGTLLDNIHSRAFPPKGESYSVKGVVESLNAAGYQTTNDRNSVTVDGCEGWISVYPDRLFFNFDGTYDMKIAASLGIDITGKSWLKDENITGSDIWLMERIQNSKPIKGGERYSIWLFNQSRRQYEYLNTYPSEQVARETIAKCNFETDVDLRLEEYSDTEKSWKCTEHFTLK